MNFEPQKFFIGLVDFFSILMPGAMLTYLGKDWIALKLGLECGFPLDSVETGFVFFVVSYLLGHFIFLVSSLLDDQTKVTHWLQDSRLGNKANAPMVRWFLLELEEEGKDWPKENRQHYWLPLTEAMQQDLYPETQSLLIAAEQKIKTKKVQTES